MRRHRVGLAALPLLVAGGTLVVASCALDLDESLIDRVADAAVLLDGQLPDGGIAPPPPPPPGDGGGPDAAGPVSCSTDAQCVTTDGCLKGHCDVPRHACVFDVCRGVCSAAACNVATRACGPQATYRYKAAQIAVGGAVCARCAVAAYPWLIAIAGPTAVAFDVSNPTSATPPRIPIEGLDFAPTQVVVSGARVWLTGAITAGGFPAAYIDIPSDPFTPSLKAHSAVVTYARSDAGFFLLPGRDQAALLVAPAAPYPAALAQAPFAPPVTLTGTPLPLVGTLAPSAATGTRVLMFALNGGDVQFDLVEGAGTAAPQAGAVTTLGGAAATTARAFASSADGAVVWVSGVSQPDGAGGTNTRAARAAFVIDGATTALTETIPAVDVEVFDVPANVAVTNQDVVGPAAMIDANIVMVTTMAKENAAQSAVQFVRKTPLGVVKEADGVTLRRAVLPFPIGAVVAATASNGVGYVIARDTNGASTLFTFDPRCGL